jgi:DNA-binding Xre family transcriptional regulator
MNNGSNMINVKIELQKILDDRKKTMYALAKEEKISYSTVHKMATKDIESIDLNILKKICKNLKCTPNDLLNIEK